MIQKKNISLEVASDSTKNVANRLEGTKELVDAYKKQTPGQSENVIGLIRRIIKEKSSRGGKSANC